MIHLTRVGLSVFDEENHTGIDIYRYNLRGPWGLDDLSRLLRSLASQQVLQSIALFQGEGADPPMRKLLIQEWPEIAQAIIEHRKKLFGNLHYVEIAIGYDYTIRLNYEPNKPFTALRRTEELLLEEARRLSVDQRRLLYTALTIATTAAMVRKQRSPNHPWLAIAAWLSGVLGSYIADWAIKHRPPNPSERRHNHKDLAHHIKKAMRQGRPLSLPEASIVDTLRGGILAAEEAWAPQVISAWASSRWRNVVPPNRGDFPLDMEILAALHLALQGAIKKPVGISIPTVGGGVKNIRVTPSHRVTLAYGQVLEFARWGITAEALTWIMGDEYPPGYYEDFSLVFPIPPETGVTVPEETLLRQVADAAVEEARQRQRYVPGGQAFLLSLDNIAPEALRLAGVQALAIWADAKGLWVRIIAPGRFSDGLTFRWRPEIGERITLYLAPWAKATLDALCAMLWRDMVIERTVTVPGSKRGRVQRTPSSPPPPPQPMPPKPRLFPRRGYRRLANAPWATWGTPAEHRIIRSPHWVMGHIRRLPPGRQRSAAAEQLAREHGIMLPEDKSITFVRPHIRGGRAHTAAEKAPIRSRGLMTLLALFGQQKRRD